MTAPAVSVVLKRSSFRKWIEEEQDERVAALIESDDEAVARILPGHREHLETIQELSTALADLHAVASWHDRAPGFRVEGPCDLVVTVGGDGTLLAASHGIGSGIPLLGVNSAPSHSVGFFCAARKGAVREAVASALDGTLKRVELARMRVELNGHALHERVLNEALFCHASPAATSRYIARLVGPENRVIDEEEQKSSGIWIGPAAGSTAAQRSAGGRTMPLGSRKLQYIVREPYQPNSHPLRMTLGWVEEGESLHLKSQMREGRIFLDGDRIMHEVTIGDVVTLRRSAESLVVLGLTRRRPAYQLSQP